jgi:sugar lactone lactonase YvrE
MIQTLSKLLMVGAGILTPLAWCTTITTYPAGTILENIAIAPTGDLYVTDLGSGSIFKVSPSGSSALFGSVPETAAGIAINTDGTLVTASGTSLYKLAADGSATLAADVAGAAFLNGLALFQANMVLATDDTANTIWKIDLLTGGSQAWLNSPLLLPDPSFPIGPNGIKLFGGAAYISVTGAGTILKVPILADGSAGTPQVYASNIAVDDFAFGADGSLFAATQTGAIVRIYPNGTRVFIPTGTLGDAAVAFGRTSSDRSDLYVVNNGGAFLGLPEGPGEASIVRLSTDTIGVTPESQVIPEPSAFVLTAIATAALFIRLKRRRVL